MLVVGGNDGSARRDLGAHQLGGHSLAHGDELHLGGDLTGAGTLQLGAAVGHDSGAGWQALVQIDDRVGVGVRAGGVVQVQILAIGEIDAALRHPQAVGQFLVDLFAALNRTRGDGFRGLGTG
ncbi:Uncharacterised protein [Mycobacteroides abscessus subsp. massiliense]|nr:Uncharacterised protein [Mycobacteroides abscessus subsp. massiliense]